MGSLRDSPIKYSQQLQLDRARKAKSLEDRLSRAVKGGTLSARLASVTRVSLLEIG